MPSVNLSHEISNMMSVIRVTRNWLILFALLFLFISPFPWLTPATPIVLVANWYKLWLFFLYICVQAICLGFIGYGLNKKRVSVTFLILAVIGHVWAIWQYNLLGFIGIFALQVLVLLFEYRRPSAIFWEYTWQVITFVCVLIWAFVYLFFG